MTAAAGIPPESIAWQPFLRPFRIPHTWRVDRGFDPGSTHPYAALFFAESNGEAATLADGTQRSWPRGTVFVVGEDYGWNGRPNEGLRLPPPSSRCASRRPRRG